MSMHFDIKRRDLLQSPEAGAARAYDTADQADFEGPGEQGMTSLADIPKCLQILEEVLVKFDVDPEIAVDLGTALFDLMEEERQISSSLDGEAQLRGDDRMRRH